MNINFKELGFEQYDVYHFGITVENVEKAAELWANVFGCGPFLYFQNPTPATFKGRPVKFYENSAFCKIGRFFMELQHFEYDEPDPELDAFLSGDKLNGINHIGFLAEDAAAASARLEAMGFPCLIHETGEGGEHFWHDARDKMGIMVEIFQKTDFILKYHKAMSEMTANWDGTDVLRREAPDEYFKFD